MSNKDMFLILMRVFVRHPAHTHTHTHMQMQLLRGHSAFDKMADDVVKSFARKLTKVHRTYPS